MQNSKGQQLDTGSLLWAMPKMLQGENLKTLSFLINWKSSLIYMMKFLLPLYTLLYTHVQLLQSEMSVL